ncbi:MAG: hypothetical protein N2039_12515 [Gemmataceae bacterium]|nr:hypothetical protein [Gemmataceae bacterium]
MNVIRLALGCLGLAVVWLAEASAEEKLPAGLFKPWIHSREEDKEGIQVYRPEGYDFPPARGRAGFEIRKGGEFIDRPIAPADGNEEIPGRWEVVSPGKIRVTFPKSPDRKAFTLEIISCDGKVLKVKQVYE